MDNMCPIVKIQIGNRSVRIQDIYLIKKDVPLITAENYDLIWI